MARLKKHYDTQLKDQLMQKLGLKNKFEVLEDRAFYTDSVYFEIVNDLVEIDLKLQNLSTTIRNYFKEKNIRINNLKLSNQKISFSVDEQFKQTILDVFNDENSDLNLCGMYPNTLRCERSDMSYFPTSQSL